MAYQAYADDPGTLGAVALRIIAGYFVGILLGVPGFVMNRKGLTDLYCVLDGKFFLSSQLALLDSRHGKNAAAYFLFLLILARAFIPLFYGSPWIWAISVFPYGVYLSANVLPFVLSPKREQAGSADLSSKSAALGGPQ